MPSPRNSKFIENFDDDESDSSSSESLASAPSPKGPSNSTFSEPLTKKFSAMVLEHTTSRAVHHLQLPAAMQPHAPAQAQAPVVVQGSGSSTVAAETPSQRAGDGTDAHQEVNPERALGEESSALASKQDTSQHEQHDAAQEPSAKTANIFLHQFFDEVFREQKITPEEMHHASKHIEANFKKLEQDLILFAGQRLQIS